MVRKIIFWLLAAAFIAYVVYNRAEINHILRAISQGELGWLLVAAASQVFFYGFQTFVYRYSFDIVGIQRKAKDLYPLVLGALFVNVLAPTAGNSGTILFADDAKKRAESAPKAVVGVFVSLFSTYAAFLIILILAIINLKIIGQLGLAEIAASIIFLIPTLIPVALVLASKYKPQVLGRIIRFGLKIQKFLNRIFNPKKKPRKYSTEKITEELNCASDSIFNNLGDLAKSLSMAFISHVFNIVCVVAIFLAFDAKIMFGAIIAGYAFGEVARVISPHPEGVGVVEVTMALIFIAFGVPPITATSISIIFRGINFWIPLGIGFIYLRRLKSFQA